MAAKRRRPKTSWTGWGVILGGRNLRCVFGKEQLDVAENEAGRYGNAEVARVKVVRAGAKKRRDPLIAQAIDALRELGRCPLCRGESKYCASCVSAASKCSCDRGGSFTPVDCTTCDGGWLPAAADFLRKAGAYE